MPSRPDDQHPDSRAGDRIAKLLARAGIASRREIERMIAEGRVARDGTVIDTPATLLTSLAGVTVDGNPVAAPAPARLFLYHKPPGLLVTERDPRGRPTIYDRLPSDLPRVVPVGRLDLATEGLLLLTTDGGFKRQLELPATGVERSYRARAYGNVTQAQLEDLMDGIEIEGVRYGSIDANIERRTGANVWIELTLAEGKNREVRRVLEHLGLQVSRLIRTRYGPFVLGDLPPGEVGEVKQHELVAFRRTLKGGSPDEPIGLPPEAPAANVRPGFRTAPTADRAARSRRPSLPATAAPPGNRQAARATKGEPDRVRPPRVARREDQATPSPRSGATAAPGHPPRADRPRSPASGGAPARMGRDGSAPPERDRAPRSRTAPPQGRREDRAVTPRETNEGSRTAPPARPGKPPRSAATPPHGSASPPRAASTSRPSTKPARPSAGPPRTGAKPPRPSKPGAPRGPRRPNR